MVNDYLIEKKPIKALLLFALPMIIGNFFQKTYIMADSAIVGRFVSEGALAAIGACDALTNIFICVAIGGGIGASVIVSRDFGSKEYIKMREAVNTALLAFLGVSILLGTVGLLLSRSIMAALHTPENVLDMADEYLRIYFIGLPFLFMYNVISSMFNALGKSRIPLGFLIFSSVFNVWLDLLLVRRYNMGIAGVAWATLIAQGISAALSFVVLVAEMKKFGKEKVRLFDPAGFSAMTNIALPSILQQSTVSIGMMLVQSVVNSFGSEALAGFSAAMRIEGICCVPLAGVANAMSSYTAQNIGAEKLERVKEGYRAANLFIAVCAVITAAITEMFTTEIISMFLGEDGTATALGTGCGYLSFIGWMYGVLGAKLVVDGLLRGAGDTRMFTIANLVNLFIRVFVANVFAPRFGIALVWYAVPAGWFANWLISYIQYRRGKWRSIYVKHAE